MPCLRVLAWTRSLYGADGALKNGVGTACPSPVTEGTEGSDPCPFSRESCKLQFTSAGVAKLGRRAAKIKGGFDDDGAGEARRDRLETGPFQAGCGGSFRVLLLGVSGATLKRL